MDMQDFYYRHISLVFDNYEDTYWTIQGYVKICKIDPTLRLGHMLAELYGAAIERALRDVPENTLGHRLISELCYGVPQHIFDELSDRYMEDAA
jgi:hypothetical protein